eukprot:GFUD01031125.1.p1 GENE.GFUD01031125.1~~GFUD01031125.1.p1  ORF type:complete len:536 (+),score=120.28 GFUD01031125.1:84-1691(+)
MFSLSTTKLEDNAAHCELGLTDFWSKSKKMHPGTHIGSHKFAIGLNTFQLVVYPSGTSEWPDVFSVSLVNCNDWDVSFFPMIDVALGIEAKTEDKVVKESENNRSKSKMKWVKCASPSDHTSEAGLPPLLKNITIEKKSECMLINIADGASASFQDVDQFKVSMVLRLSSAMLKDVSASFDTEDSFVKYYETEEGLELLKGLDSESQLTKDAQMDSKLDSIHSNVSQMNSWMCSIKDSVDKLRSEVVKMKGDTSRKASNSKESSATEKECPTSRDFDFFSARDMCSSVSSEILSLREDIESTRSDQWKDLELLRDDVQTNTKGLRKLYYKVDDADVEMKSKLGNFEAKLNDLPTEIIDSEKKVILRMEKLQSDLASNASILAEMKSNIAKRNELEYALRKEITGLSSKLTENLSVKQKENSYNSVECFQWIWGKVDQDSQTLGKMVEEQVEAQTLVLLDTFNQKTSETLAAPECPYCMEELRPPRHIFQCFTGHLICEKCLAKWRDCPTCSQKIIGRNRGLESFLETASVVANWN